MRHRLASLAALSHDSVNRALDGSRTDLEHRTSARVDAGLVVLVLAARAIHLVQAAVDATVGRGAYSSPRIAALVAAACIVESVVLALALARRRRLTFGVLAADAVFGLAGLTLMSLATTSTAGRTGTIDWMLPYTVTTVVGLGLLAFRATPGAVERARGDWRGAAFAVALACAYATSVSLPELAPGDTVRQVVTDTANYPVFYLCAAGVSLWLRRRVESIAALNEAAKRAAADVAAEAHWRVVAVDVFGPVLDLLDRATELGDHVPVALREEADRLIDLIEAANPGTDGGR